MLECGKTEVGCERCECILDVARVWYFSHRDTWVGEMAQFLLSLVGECEDLPAGIHFDSFRLPDGREVSRGWYRVCSRFPHHPSSLGSALLRLPADHLVWFRTRMAMSVEYPLAPFLPLESIDVLPHECPRCRAVIDVCERYDESLCEFEFIPLLMGIARGHGEILSPGEDGYATTQSECWNFLLHLGPGHRLWDMVTVKSRDSRHLNRGILAWLRAGDDVIPCLMDLASMSCEIDIPFDGCGRGRWLLDDDDWKILVRRFVNPHVSSTIEIGPKQGVVFGSVPKRKPGPNGTVGKGRLGTRDYIDMMEERYARVVF